MSEQHSEHMTTLVRTTVDFIRQVTRVYGAERGMALWDSLAVDQDLRSQVLVYMLTGSVDSVCIHGFDTSLRDWNGVSIIKTIRSVSRLGLKEAKDIYDALRSGQRNIVLKIDLDYPIKDAIATLEQVGLSVS